MILISPAEPRKRFVRSTRARSVVGRRLGPDEACQYKYPPRLAGVKHAKRSRPTAAARLLAAGAVGVNQHLENAL
jgi:hypothetical protein